MAELLAQWAAATRHLPRGTRVWVDDDVFTELQGSVMALDRWVRELPPDWPKRSLKIRTITVRPRSERG